MTHSPDPPQPSDVRRPADDRSGQEAPAPDGLSPATIEAVGKLTEAFETVEVARGHLYAFHQLTGSADFALEDAIGLLEDAGHTEFAGTLARQLLGRNVLPGRWTYQVVEEYEDTYYRLFQEFVRQGRELVGGLRHLHEAELKRNRRTPGEPGHEASPAEVGETVPRDVG